MLTGKAALDVVTVVLDMFHAHVANRKSRMLNLHTTTKETTMTTTNIKTLDFYSDELVSLIRQSLFADCSNNNDDENDYKDYNDYKNDNTYKNISTPTMMMNMQTNKILIL